MSYKYDVFISYKWSGEYKEWVDKVFYPLILKYFISEYNENPTFKDIIDIPHGATADQVLKDAVTSSKCMIAVLSAPYFCKSIWCPTEFSAILHRQKQVLNPSDSFKGLLFPVIFTIFDQKTNKYVSSLTNKCPRVAALVENLTPLRLEEDKYFHLHNSFIDSEAYGQLRMKVRRWLEESVIPSIQEAPKWQPEWRNPAWWDDPYNQFLQTIDCRQLKKEPQM
ncbi:toll/interleukin-1 receptor domain-containing protein [Flavisolibacter sp. BT320]|nr:toll/interleukin-1 receptor domain-containing protein [Flavisolibacter longurius]